MTTAGVPRLQTPGDSAFTASYLDHWAEAIPERVATRYLDYEGSRHGTEVTVTYGELWAWSKRLAAHLNAVTEPGDRVALLVPQGIEYGVAFVACLSSHAVAVPLFAPDLLGQGDRLNSVVTDCTPRVLLTTGPKRDLVLALAAQHGTDERRVLAVEDFRAPDATLDTAYAFPSGLDLDDVAYLQYTSGSTRAPVGVALTHRNLVDNVFQLRDAFHLEVANAATVSWLPLFHDMGLVLGVAAPLMGGLEAVLLDPLAFIIRPVRWLRALDGRRNVMTAAPNFAFDYVSKRVPEKDLEGIDLSGVVGWINGAEPVLPATLERFRTVLAGCGVDPTSVKPTYGLAEATVFVATSPRGTLAPTFEVDAHELQHGRATTEIASDLKPTTLVSCGRGVGQQVAIADPETGRRLPEGEVGEVWVHGTNVGRGYWQRPGETADLFDATLGDAGELPERGWLRTQDLGVILAGDLCITGRIKDLIIIDGRNILPHDIEFTVEDADPAIAKHRLAAFSIPTDGGEALVVVAERYRHAADANDHLDRVSAAARDAVAREHAVALHDLVLVEPDTIARTSSGKIARQATRTSYLAWVTASS